MAIGLVMTFDGVTKEHYESVMGPHGLDLKSPEHTTGGDDWPTGILAHWAGPTPTGWCVVDVWESQQAFDDFFAARLGPAMQKHDVPQPNVTPFEVYNSHT